MEEILARIAALYDPIELLDILDMDMQELVFALEEQITSNLHKFKDLDIGDWK